MKKRQWFRLGGGGLAALLAAAAVAAGVGTGGVPADAWALGDGMAWVPMSTTGEVVLLDGTTGRLAGRIGGLGAGPLVVALDGSNAVVLNPDAEAAFRVDAASQTLAGVGSAGETGIRFPHAERVVVGGDVGYVLQPDLQQVQAIDPVTLRPLGPPTVFVGSDFDAAAGEEGSLWLLDREAGRLQEVDGSRQGAFADLGWTEEDAGVVLVDDLPVVVNRTRGTVATVDAETGRLQDRVECQWFRRGEHGVQVGGSPGSPWLALAVPTTGTVLVADLLAEDCAAPIAVADLGSSFGAPVSADGLVYVPVISTGMVVVVDPRRETIVGQNQVVDQPGTHFELVVDDGLVFFNAPFSHESGVVSPQADVARIDKSQTLGGAGDSACTVSSQQVAVGDPIAFAIDEDGTPFDRAEWRFGDGKEANGLHVEHVYSAPGRYEPTVALNGVVVACPAITVDEQDVARLEARIGGPAQVVVGETVTYTDVTDAEVATREWRLPGGTPPTADTETVEVRFATPGIQVIELTVSGPAGNDTAEARIEVLTVAPTDRRDPRAVPDPDGTGGGSPTAPEPSPSSPSGPPPPASGCANPTATLSGERATVSAGGSVRFDLVFGPDANRCEVTGIDWFVNGTVVASGAETLTQRFDAPGGFELRATFTYRTAQGAAASGLPNPAALPITVAPQPAVSPFVGNWLGTGTGHFDIAARSPTVLDVHVFGDCVPSACDVGVQTGTVTAPTTATLDYDDGVARRNITLQVGQGGQVLDTTWLSTYPPGDARGVNCWTSRYRLGSAGDPTVLDHDCDGVPESVDNCPGPFENGDNSSTANPNQADGDGDGIGDVCDPLGPVFAQGTIDVPQTFLVDLDTGVVGGESGEDLWFHAVTGTERYYERDGALHLEHAGAQPAGACAGPNVDRVDVNAVPAGNWLCVVTDAGRVSHVQILVPPGPSPGTVRLQFITYG